MTKISLRRSFVAIVMLTLVILIAASSYVTRALVWQGELSAQRLLMLHAGQQAEAMLALHPNAPLLHTDNLQVFQGWQRVPDSLKEITLGKQPERIHEMIKNPDGDPRIGALMRFPRSAGEDLYILLRFDPQQFRAHSNRLFQPILLINTLVAILVLGAGWFIYRHVLTPINGMSQRLRKVDWQNLDNSIKPQVRYLELQTVYDAFYASMTKVKQQQQSEKRFLRFASHELRSPIAVLQSSFELMERQQPLSPAAERGKHATTKMANITETLLWLGHQQLDQFQKQQTALLKLIQETALEFSSNALQIEGDDYQLPIAKQPLQIALSNLIRNAIEHGHGPISITQRQSTIEINNLSAGHDSRGFGLGLMLVEQVADAFGWQVNHIEQQGHHQVIFNLQPVGISHEQR